MWVVTEELILNKVTAQLTFAFKGRDLLTKDLVKSYSNVIISENLDIHL